MKEAQITEENIKMLVNNFYGKVRNDKDLAPVFKNAIGDDASLWQPHLERMYSFWSSVILSTGSYSGNPFQKHRDLPAFDIKLFDRWLELFAETAKEIYTEEASRIFIAKSENIARSLKLGIYGKTESSNT